MDLDTQLRRLSGVLRDRLDGECGALVVRWIEVALRAVASMPVEVCPPPGSRSGASALLAYQYTQALLRHDRLVASRLVIHAAGSGMDVADLYLDVFQQSQYTASCLWADDSVDAGQDHFLASASASDAVMIRLYPLLCDASQSTAGYSIVVVSVADEQHTLGARVASNFFEMAGWSSYYTGPKKMPRMNDVIAQDFQSGTGQASSTIGAGLSEVMLVLAGRDGCVRFCNPPARQHFAIQTGVLEGRSPIWEWFIGKGAQLLRSQAATQPAGASSWLDLLTYSDRALHCQLEWFAQHFVLLAEDVVVKPGSVAHSRDSAERRDAGARWLEGQRLALVGAVEALQGRNTELERSNAHLMALAHTDMLTGLYNRYRFEEMLEAEIGRARRSQSALCVVMVDLDLFKLVNDHLGHDIGDVALVGAARALRTSGRPYDVVARYGGEEFVLLLPDTGLRAGAECAERLRRAVETESASSVAPVTASLGVAALAPGEDKKSLLRRADAALYLAKRRGRNRVECDQTVDTA